MSALGIALVWCAIQVTLVAAFASVVYLAARKVAPAARALTIQTSLLVCSLLAVLALSPWPRWWSSQPETQPVPQIAAIVAQEPDLASASSASATASADISPAPDTAAALPTRTADSGREFASAFWNNVLKNLQPAPPVQKSSHAWGWPQMLAAAFLVGVGLALLRVAMGLRAVAAYRRFSTPIKNRRISEMVDVVCAELNCRRQIQVRESAELATPATTGWRHPVIFFPAEWTNWTDAQCRAVLAHEISHIDRNDFLTSLCARVGVAVHFYHPLVHWLMQRLTLEQELAADADAARVAGGQRQYLTILAEMALAQSNRPIRWPARTFLPTRGTFLRRIEMLRDSQHLSRSVSPGLRALAIGIVLIGGITAAGIRAPDSGTVQAQSESEGTGVLTSANTASAEATSSASHGIELAYVPSDTVMVAAIRPAEVLDRPEWKAFSELMDSAAGVTNLLKASASTVEQVSLVLVGQRSRAKAEAGSVPLSMQNFGSLMIRMKEPNEFAALLADFGHSQPFEELQAGNHTYFVSRNNPLKEAYFRPDDRTIVLGLEYQITRLLANGPENQSELLKDASWSRVSAGSAAVLIDGQWARTVNLGVAGPLLSIASPLLEESNILAVGLTMNKEFGLSVIANCRNDEGAATVKQTCDALITLGKNAIRNQPVSAEISDSERELVTGVIGATKTMLDTAKVEKQGNVVSAQIRLAVDGDLFAQLTKKALAAGGKARGAATRMQSKNNLKQIGLAMHNFHDVYRRFPKAVELGPDGKTPHSWRVALLPYLDKVDLYAEYQLNEPWDSENNKKVLAKMPPVYRYPADEAKEPNSSYYVMTGKGTMFEPDKATMIKEVSDGTSNTLLAVEVKRDIPWTKPEDIPYDPEKDPPTFGGFDKEGTNILICDGSVRFVDTNALDKQTLKYFIEKADHHPINLDGGTAPKASTAPSANQRTILPARQGVN